MSRKTILLVDDDPVFVEAISAVLEGSYELEVASNGTEALEKIDQRRPDLIVLDVMMDHPSEGFDVARKLRKDEDRKSIPLIILTGVDKMYDYRMQVDESWVPCDRYLQKPVEPTQLLDQVRELIG
jgi:CheY-like chemotaxis protein